MKSAARAERAEKLDRREQAALSKDVEDVAGRKRDVAADTQSMLETTAQVLDVCAKGAATIPGLAPAAAVLEFAAWEVDVLAKLNKEGKLFKFPPSSDEEVRAKRVIFRRHLDEDAAEEARIHGVHIPDLRSVPRLTPTEKKKLPADPHSFLQRLRTPSGRVGTFARSVFAEADRWHRLGAHLHTVRQKDPNFVTAFTAVADERSIQRVAARVRAHDSALVLGALRHR